MTEKEIKELNIHEVYYILLNEKNLYTSKEIAMLEQRKKELDIKYKEEEYIEEVKNRPLELKCPKCDGINKSSNVKCEYCGYTFKREDYFNNEDVSEKNSNIILYIISFLLPIIGIILGIVYISKDNEELGKKLILFSIVIFIVFFFIFYSLL